MTPVELSDLALELARRGGANGSAAKAVERLVAESSGRRELLEEARSILVLRIRRRSGDFEATGALSLVLRALSEVGHERQPFTAGPTGARLIAPLQRLNPLRRRPARV